MKSRLWKIFLEEKQQIFGALAKYIKPNAIADGMKFITTQDKLY